MALNEKLPALAAFEDTADIGAIAQYIGHHEEGHSLQMRFAKDVFSVISVLQTKHPFLPQNGPVLVMLQTREIMPSAIAQALSNAYEKDKDLHESFIGVHSFPVAIVPAVFRLGQFLQVRKAERAITRKA